MSKVENLPVKVLHAFFRSVRRLHLTEVDYQRENLVVDMDDVKSAGKVRSTEVVLQKCRRTTQPPPSFGVS